MATFVLVHGAWHGGWCWKKVTPLLRAAGHEVYTPTLTGLGERVHLLGPTVGLETHVEDVLGLLHYEDLHHVVLVGHSYGGMVITGVADRSADRLAHLVYLDAFVPQDGQCLLDLAPLPPVAEDGWRIPALPLEWLGVSSEADLAWAAPKVGAQPRLSFEQPVRSASEAVAALPRTFICCNQPAPSTFGPFPERARADASWHYREIGTGHDAMITAPRELADLLLDVV